jgi:hypothetical protein
MFCSIFVVLKRYHRDDQQSDSEAEEKEEE